MLTDSQLERAVKSLPVASFEGEVFRYTSPDFEPLSSEGARRFGGRWNPPGLSALYFGATIEAVVTDLYYWVASQGGHTIHQPWLLHRVHLSGLSIVDLRGDAALAAVGLSIAEDRGPCQRVGEAVFAAGIQGLIAPSAAGADDVVLTLYPAALTPGTLKLLDTRGLWSTPSCQEWR